MFLAGLGRVDIGRIVGNDGADEVEVLKTCERRNEAV